MDNIYSQDELSRNSIVELPEGFAEKSGDTLYSWLGSLWRSVHMGDKMVRGLQKARGIRLAQLYLDILEAAKLQDRNGMPVFHRELWHPIVIRSSERDTAQENMLDMGDGAVMGLQTDPESPYGPGTVLQMGRLANYKYFVTYPVDRNVVGMSASIVDNIINPTIVLNRADGDFEFRNNSIIFRREADPLAKDSPFDKYDVPGTDPEDPGKSDVETVLWASDVLIDRNYVADHLSYPLGADSPSSDIVKRILNAAWSSVASGLTPELLRTFIAAMLNIPVVQNETETVIGIDSSDDAQEIRTDKCLYRVSPKARIADGIRSGAVLHRGDLLDESLRVYPFLNTPQTRRQRFSVPLEQDIPSITLPTDILSAKTEYGVYSTWGKQVVKRSKTSPGSDEFPHLYFDMGGTEQDRDAFWREAWKNSEKSGRSMADIIGEEGAIVSPAEFLLDNFVGANTMFVVVDSGQIDDASLLRDPMFFGMLTSVVPSAMRLFLVEHRPVCDDEMDIGDAQESTFLAAALPMEFEHMPAEALPGLDGRGPSFGDRVQIRFVRPVPEKKRARKEEE